MSGSKENGEAELLALRSLWIKLLLYYADGYVMKRSLFENAAMLPAGAFAELAQDAGLLRIESDVDRTTMVGFTESGFAALTAAGLSDGKALSADEGAELGFVVVDSQSY